MQDLRIHSLIHKRLSGEISPEELLELEALEKSEDIQLLNSDIETIWNNSRNYFPQRSFDVNAAKASVKGRIRNTTSVKTPENIVHPDNSLKSPSKVFVIALVAALILMMGYLTYNYLFDSNTEEPTEFINQSDQIEYALLEDKSEVWLSPSAILQVSNFEKDGIRKVKLEGEAFFKVTPEENQPFQVHLAKDNIVEVIGTSFNLKSSKEGTVNLGVKEGIVKIFNKANPDNHIIVSAGESGSFNHETDLAEKHRATAINTVLGPVFNFNKASLDQIFSDLEKVFQIKFAINDDSVDLSTCLFTSPLVDSLSLKEIITLIDEYYPDLAIEKSGENNYKVSGHCN